MIFCLVVAHGLIKCKLLVDFCSQHKHEKQNNMTHQRKATNTNKKVENTKQVTNWINDERELKVKIIKM